MSGKIILRAKLGSTHRDTGKVVLLEGGVKQPSPTELAVLVFEGKETTNLLYYDECGEEINDSLFRSVSDAKEFASEAFLVTQHDWNEVDEVWPENEPDFAEEQS